MSLLIKVPSVSSKGLRASSVKYFETASKPVMLPFKRWSPYWQFLTLGCFRFVIYHILLGGTLTEERNSFGLTQLYYAKQLESHSPAAAQFLR
jgi:hypothetical protein